MKNDHLQTGPVDQISEVAVNIESLGLNKIDIIKHIGYSNETVDDHFSGMIDSIILKAECLLDIKTGFRIVDFNKSDIKKNGVFLNNVFFKTDNIIAGQLKKSEKAAIFLVTIGNGLENWSKKELKNGDPVLSYLIDVSATVMTEALANFLHQHIRKRVKREGLNVTNRFSPGYCNWHVREQHKLFSLLPENFCSITLMESALMVPEKSISGMIGIGPQVEWKAYICDKCNKVDCLYKIH